MTDGFTYHAQPEPYLDGPRRCPLDRAWLSVGSDPACDLALPGEDEVEPQHARLEVTPKGVYLIDLESRHGTWLNARRITRALLHEGDQIGFGRSVGKRGSASEVSVELTQQAVVAAKVTRVSRLQVLLEVATELSRPERLEVRLDQILSIMLELLPFDRVSLSILSEPAPRLRGEPKFSRHAWRTRYGQGSGEEPPKLSSTIIRKVLSEGHGLKIADALFDAEFGQARSVQNQEIRTCVCLPLKTSRNLIGVLYADARNTLELGNDEDLAFVSAFSAHAAVAVENALLSERIEEEAGVRARLERFLPPSAVEEMLRRPEAGSVGGRELEVTVLFCDIRNYTELSQRLTPSQVAALLNDYFPEMVRLVFRHGGTLEKYIGDALMAIWGAPLALSPPEQVQRALAVAREMQQVAQGLPVEIGIGINTGTAFVGNIGDDTYLQYAAIGEATNLASRLCSQAAGGEIVLSESSRVLLSDESLNGSSERVKGYAEPIKLFRA